MAARTNIIGLNPTAAASDDVDDESIRATDLHISLAMILVCGVLDEGEEGLWRRLWITRLVIADFFRIWSCEMYVAIDIRIQTASKHGHRQESL